MAASNWFSIIVIALALLHQGTISAFASGSSLHHGESCNPFAEIASTPRCSFGLKCSKSSRTCEYAQEGEPCIPNDTSESKTTNIPIGSRVFCSPSTGGGVRRNGSTSYLKCELIGSTEYGQKSLGKCVSTKPGTRTGPTKVSVASGAECDLFTSDPIVPGKLFVCSPGLTCLPESSNPALGKCGRASSSSPSSSSVTSTGSSFLQPRLSWRSFIPG